MIENGQLIKKFWWIGLIILIAIIIAGVLFIKNRNNKREGPAVLGPTITEVPVVSGPEKKSTSSPDDDISAPTLFLPYSMVSNPADMMTPMGETLYHPDPPNPGGHAGIDFQWENPSAVPTIIASMEGTVSAINESASHQGTFDVITTNGKWGVDYAEMGSVRDNLKAGDKIKVGDIIGIPQHPNSITDKPKFRMIHWQFGYSNGASGIGERLCPLTYFDPNAKLAIEALWADTNSIQLKANAPNICSGKYQQ